MPLPRSVLVVGSGGREHALVLALAKSPAAPRLLCAPGNPGIAELATCMPIAADEVAGLIALAQREHIEFVVVGPEVPLALGLVDELTKVGIPAYGPKADGARLEASKIYTKEILQKYGIPTAPAAFFTEPEPAIAYLRARPAPIVVKADGLAAGKGVVVAATHAEAEAAVHSLLALTPQSKIANQKSKILLEDCLVGEETSILVVVSGRDYVVLPTSQDHKRVGEGDTGPNTGGMGTYSPAEVVTPALLARIDREIVRPSVDAIAAEGIDFRGTLFIGIMLTADGPSVLEFNTRFGDPETQVVLPRIENDLLGLLWAAAKGQLAGTRLKISSAHALCVVIAAKGYPNNYPKGDAITLPKAIPCSVSILHAGTARTPAGQLVTHGGRVLGVTALAPTLHHAALDAYAVCDAIQCASKYFRRDIGARQLLRG
ncbi:phosphoribosylamine--glycine ligase [Opitutus terrae]|uniref:Phosphoribosylamine--glycine ligase n=1 Tax=Opitutus terrae (strain DSM 11246 / JCM 15787 / PB90-1) TaxID=452637 RepID=B1ZZW5_OPITP|nr:phosphoribosylamine--glycine ligase [Opitutus terrae]ACB77298.1 phosphoribosylamine--glycine ligase [Opitutus terrae PB90-1]